MADAVIQYGSAEDLLVEKFKDNQVWADLSEAIAFVFGINIEAPIRLLSQIRAVNQDSDEELLDKTARMLGFDLTQDVLLASKGKMLRLISQLPLFPDKNSTELFDRFVSLMIDGFCNVTYLWTEDYVNFYSEPQGTLLEDGGRWFNTTHVDLNIGFLSIDNLQLSPNQSLHQKAKDIFYQLAPATLVVERMSLSAYDKLSIGVAASMYSVKKVCYL